MTWTLLNNIRDQLRRKRVGYFDLKPRALIIEPHVRDSSWAFLEDSRDRLRRKSGPKVVIYELVEAGIRTVGDDRAENLVGAIARYVKDCRRG